MPGQPEGEEWGGQAGDVFVPGGTLPGKAKVANHPMNVGDWSSPGHLEDAPLPHRMRRLNQPFGAQSDFEPKVFGEGVLAAGEFRDCKGLIGNAAHPEGEVALVGRIMM